MKALRNSLWGLLALLLLIIALKSPLHRSTMSEEGYGAIHPQYLNHKQNENESLEARSGFRAAFSTPVERRASISGALIEAMQRAEAGERLEVIVRLRPSEAPAELIGTDVRPLHDGYATDLSASQIRDLAQDEHVSYLTLDTRVRAMEFDDDDDGDDGEDDSEGDEGDEGEDGEDDLDDFLAGQSARLAAIGADRAQARGLTGAGITVAVFDSGIGSHSDLGETSRVIASLDFTSGEPVFVEADQDDYGHGTHVAGIIGGSGSESNGLYRGVAPGVSYLDVKVIGTDGTGQASKLIRAIDWVIEHKDEYGVKVANLSLGRAPIEVCSDDPLCRAVERLTTAGIVTVVSAGNLGATSEHPRIWGGTTSPGNSAAVITVGAINTRSTADHQDDIATSYSSRGPTYGEGLFKPDLSAPGNRVISLKADDSHLAMMHPQLVIDDDHIALAGSSMSAAYVSGAVALLLEANPQLTPRIIKAILMISAIKLKQPHMLEQGNGLINVFTAVRLAQAIDAQAHQLVSNVPGRWELDEEPVYAGGAFAFADRIYHQPHEPVELWGDGRSWRQRPESGWAAHLFDPDSILWTPLTILPEGAIWGDGVLWSDSGVWGGEAIWGEGVIWAEAARQSEPLWDSLPISRETSYLELDSAFLGDD